MYLKCHPPFQVRFLVFFFVLVLESSLSIVNKITYHFFMQDYTFIQGCAKGRDFDTRAVGASSGREDVIQVNEVGGVGVGVDTVERDGVGCGHVDDVVLVLTRASLASCWKSSEKQLVVTVVNTSWGNSPPPPKKEERFKLLRFC